MSFQYTSVIIILLLKTFLAPYFSQSKVKVVKSVYQILSQSALAVLSIWVFLEHMRHIPASGLVFAIQNLSVTLSPQ